MGLALMIFSRYTSENTYVAAFHFTIALLSGGPALITHPPVWYKPELVKTEKELEDEELKEYRLVLYSSNDPRRKANAALLMALYVVCELSSDLY